VLPEGSERIAQRHIVFEDEGLLREPRLCREQGAEGIRVQKVENAHLALMNVR